MTTLPLGPQACVPIGLEGATLEFGESVTRTVNGLTAHVYRTTIPGIDLESRASPRDQMLDFVFQSDGVVESETGMYYWPAGDLTVDIHSTQGFVGSWDEQGWSVEWRVLLYQGDVIAAVFDPREGELDDVIDTLEKPICEVIVQVTGTHVEALSGAEDTALVYAGEFGGGIVTVAVDQGPSALVTFQHAGGRSELLGRFDLSDDGTFEGPIPQGSIQGTVASEQTRMVFLHSIDDTPHVSIAVARRRE